MKGVRPNNRSHEEDTRHLSRPASFRQLGLAMMACVLLFVMVNLLFQLKLRRFLPSVLYTTAVQSTSAKPEIDATTITGDYHPPVLLEQHSDDHPSSVFFRNRLACKDQVNNNSVSLYVQKCLALIDPKMAAFTSTSNHPNNVERAALCVVQKDEDWYLQEWIDYHLALGFTDIYIFNHGNADITSTLQVHSLPVNNIPHRPVHVQLMVYNACLKIIQQRMLPQHGSYNTTWVAFLDVDEFLVLKKHETVQAFMADHCPNENGLCGSVGINWQWFGTSNHTYFEPNKPVTQRFLYRDYQPHKIIKSIIRVDEAYCLTSAHFSFFRRSDPLQNKSQPPFSYDTSGRILWGPYSHQRLNDVAVVNHYTNSLEEWYARRCRRGDVNQRVKNRRCNGKFPDAGYVYDDWAASFYQTHVLDQNRTANDLSLVRPPAWKHYPKSEFDIQEIIPLSQIAPELPKNDETKPSPKNETGYTALAEHKVDWLDWKKQIPPAILQSYLPKGFPEPPAAETIQNTTFLGEDYSIPSFIQKRHECIAHVRQLHQERFDSVSTWTRNSNITQHPLILYVDPAYHKNVGDDLLTLGTLTFLLRQGVSDIQQCHYWQSLRRVPPCEEVIPANNRTRNETFKLAIVRKNHMQSYRISLFQYFSDMLELFYFFFHSGSQVAIGEICMSMHTVKEFDPLPCFWKMDIPFLVSPKVLYIAIRREGRLRRRLSEKASARVYM